ncbi:TonB-dependent receptor domain-containing protein [Acidovorax sp. NB1]|uniref:TonB-dependent receptor domain-containing protein n=1 Tax=Acidovorax sp. NB1 TaxID=1943571 RepID=UPI0014855829|nr:TonB-dependent receptor [Acidovorax sp. NB1]
MLALSGAGPIAQAQTTALAAAEATPSLPPVTVSASGLQLGTSDMTTPATVLEGDELVRRREATLGETLNSEPGITSSHFGAGASRPIIRGMDGPRVKVLSDGAELHDASTISPDHAVVSEPLLATQIEVLRGPSALIYGNGAVGGVVNVLDGKVPTAVPAKGLEGSAELRANSGAREGAGAFSLTGGTGNLAVHVEGVARDAGDYRVGKGWAPEDEATRKVLGSFNRTNTGSVGLSWVGDRGYLGAAYTRQAAKYGLPGHNHSFEGCHTHGNQLHCGAHEGEEDGHDHDHGAGHGDVPVVDLRSERFDIRGELRNPFAGFSALRLRAGVTDYVHDEVEDGAVSTTFKNKAYDTRIELQHEPIAGFKGVIGLQTSQRKFSAEGEEAYVQPTVTRRTGLFALEEYRLGDWRFEAALRHDRQTARAETSDIERSHNGTSASLGAVWKFTPGYQLGASFTRASRAPSAEELYARGLHMATSTYERGDASLRSETSQNFDLSLKKTAGDTTFGVSVFRNRINNYIYGRTLDALDGLQLLQYSQADATFTGIEGQVRQRLNRNLGITLFGDTVRARIDGAGNLPRIPATRAGLRLDGNWNAWEGQVEWVQVARQNRIAAFETATPGYGMLNVGLAYNGQFSGGTPWQVYLKGTNLTDRLAYAHTSFIKNAAPLMGRNLTVGVKVAF